MIDLPSAPATPSERSFSGSLTGGTSNLGKQEFLQLLVAQLQNQNPMDPSGPEEFAAQLAQFSSLEQLVNVNDNLEAQLASNAAVTAAVVASSAMNLAGRDVLVAGNTLVVDASGESEPLTIGVASPGGEATLRILDDAGKLVEEVELGPVRGGRQTIPLNEKAPDLEEGRYTYEVTVISDGGEPVEVKSFYRMRVEGVRFGPAGPQVSDGVQEFSIADILEIINGQ
jgi:flagellar basal-body rod modification protein FlgD